MRGKQVFGIILVLLGAGFLLDQIGLINFGNVINLYWPMILILIAVVGLFNKRSSKTGNLIVLLLGVMLQVNNLDILDVNLFKLVVPILLIILGLKVLFSKGIDFEKNVVIEVDSQNVNTNSVKSQPFIKETALLSGLTIKNHSQEFRGGDITAVMGGIDLDLRSAKIIDKEAILDITTIMGGIDILVPADWRVEIKGSPVLGGISNKSQNTDPHAPLLKIKASVILGGMDVK